MSSSEQPSPERGAYRVRPAVWVGVVLALAYIVLVFGLQLASGLSYDEWVDTAEHGIRAAIIPLAAGVLLLVAFIAWARWDMLWRDPERLPMTRAMSVAMWFFVVAIVVRFALADWGSVDIALLLVVIGAGILVGFAEEMLFRGIFLRAVRTGGRDEARAALWTAVGFGLFHLPNLLVSGGAGALQVGQVVVAGITGVALYVFRRRWGFILPAMIAHGVWDMSTFLALTNEATWAQLVSVLIMAISLVTGIVALVSIWRKDQGVVVTPRGVLRPTVEVPEAAG